MRINSFISFGTLISSSHSSFGNTTTVVDDMEFVIERSGSGMPYISGRSSVDPTITDVFPEFTSGEGEYTNGGQFLLYTSMNYDGISSLIVPIPDHHSSQAFSVGFGSPFANMAESMMMIPVNAGEPGTRFRMIVSPSDPLSFCPERSMMMVPYWNYDGGFRAAISLRSHGSQMSMSLGTTFVGNQITEGPYSVDGSFTLETNTRVLGFPIAIRRIIYAEIHARSVDEHYSQVLQPGCADMLHELPTIQMALYNALGSAGTISLAPEDYIEVNLETGECRILVALEDAGTGKYSLGLPFVEKMGVFFDYTNDQYGFCEPI